MTHLFGGANLQTPADRKRLPLKSNLELRRKRWRLVTGRKHLYRCTRVFLLAHGRFYPGSVLDDTWVAHRGPMSNCYENAMRAALNDPRLRYVERLRLNRVLSSGKCALWQR